MWAVLQNEAEPLIGALEMDAACVVVNLFMLPDEPDLFRQCVQNISRVRADCDTLRHAADDRAAGDAAQSTVRGGYMVDGDADKIVTLTRLAREMGADIVKADPTSNPEDFHRVVEAARCPVLVRGGGKEDLRVVLRKIRGPDARRAPWAWSMAATSTSTPIRAPWCAALMAIIHEGAERRGSVGALPAVADRAMPMIYLLGLDAGNTVIKAVIFDLDGNEIAAASEEGHSRMPAPAMSSVTWTNSGPMQGRSSAPVSQRAKIRPEDIAAIGCAGHGNGLYALDRDGAPLLGIQSLDTRASGAGRRNGARPASATGPIRSPASVHGPRRRRRCLPG